jgi:hypothetical protein
MAIITPDRQSSGNPGYGGSMKQGFFALAICLVVSAGATVARAETIFLTCGKFNITVDLTNNTANNFPAKINTTTIDWQVQQSYPSGQTAIAYWHIDRVAGTATHYFTLSGTAGSPVTSAKETESCARSSRPPTKF